MLLTRALMAASSARAAPAVVITAATAAAMAATHAAGRVTLTFNDFGMAVSKWLGFATGRFQLSTPRCV